MDSTPPVGLTEPGTQPSRRRVTRLHTLERVRDNQRRHRARRRDYIAELEGKVGEAERQVASLHDKIQALEAELNQCTCRNSHLASGIERSSSTSAGGLHSTMTRAPPREPSAETSLPLQHRHRGMRAGRRILQTHTKFLFLYRLDHTQAPAVLDLFEANRAAPSKSNTILPIHYQPESSALDFSPGSFPGWHDLQWNASLSWQARIGEESTMPCAEAYVLITQQNYRCLAEEDITARLRSDFRQSCVPGEGCHVRTDALFSLLAFISET